PRIRRLAREQIMIERRDDSGSEAQQEAVERQMMIDLAPVARPLVFIDAADTAAIEIAQAACILHRLPQRRRIREHADRLADITPEGADAHRHGYDRIEQRS